MNHFDHARRVGIDHGEAVLRARGFCLSGRGAGPHGISSPCDKCIDKAIAQLVIERGMKSLAAAFERMTISMSDAIANVDLFARALRRAHRPWKRNARRYL